MNKPFVFRQLLVTPWEFEMLVDGEAYPSESARVNDIDGGYPGSPAFADIYSVMIGGVDVMEMLTAEQYTTIQSAVLRALDIY